MVPMRAQKRKEAFHEPHSQAIGNEQNNRDRFMASIQVRILEVSPLHEPPLSRPAATLSPPCGERAGRGVPIWFMAPMRVQILEVPPTHEPAIGARTAMSARINSEALADKAVRAPVRRWFMVPMRDSEIVETSHEPYPLIPSFSPSGGEGARRAVEGDSDRFMVPMHAKKRKRALREPTHLRPFSPVR